MSTQAEDHEAQVIYTIYDDGLHIVCSCGAEISLGFGPAPMAVWDAYRVHVSQCPVACSEGHTYEPPCVLAVPG